MNSDHTITEHGLFNVPLASADEDESSLFDAFDYADFEARR